MIPIITAAGASLIMTLVVTPFIIRFFRDRGFGQLIREDAEHIHAAKAGTPTMGGTAIVVAAAAAFLAAHLVPGTDLTPKGLLVLGTFVGMGAVGFLDDFIKIRMNRNLGLSKTAKFGGQALVAAVFAFAGTQFAGISLHLSFVRELDVILPSIVFFVWVFVMLSGWSNAVNLTDGLDGLAAGSGVLVLMAYTIIAFWQARHPASYAIAPADAIDMAIMAAAAMAACTGFLWWNAPPARIFMGDTGALAIGGLLAAMAFGTNTQLLLVSLGGLYVLETLSVIVQVVSFRVFGRRVLHMAPLHHHFEMEQWHETTVIVRFWILAGVSVAGGIGIFYAEYLATTGTSP